MEPFIPGQRWISHAEIQLGLGTIVDSDHRTVTICFEAGGETRTYAQLNAPLTRVIYHSGDQVKTIHGDTIEIDSVTESEGIICYSGMGDRGQPISLAERDLDPFMQLNRPAERLFSGQIDNNRWFELRYSTLQQLNQLSHCELAGLSNCRTSLIPHQLFIAHEVANRYAPRVLLADEVGLGKTIEAGLIIHHQLLNERARRVLIIVPESLQHQWLVEMLRRFNLMFSIFDLQRCQAITDEDNVFHSEQKVLCSLEFLTQNPLYYQQLLDGDWDLLVVDEAHHLHWTPDSSSAEYRLIEQLAQRTRGILLLTATPEQLGIESHFARLRLLDPERFPDLPSFIAEEQGYRPIAHAMEAILSNRPFDESVRKTLKAVLREEHSLEHWHVDKQEIIEHMLDRHGTGRVLFRNTRAAIKGFPGRRVKAYPQKIPQPYVQCLNHFLEQAQDSIAQPQSDYHIDIPSGFCNQVLFPEIIYQTLSHELSFNRDWRQIDPRVQWLGDWLTERLSSNLQDNQPREENKTLVIAANAQTAKELADYLTHHYGIYATLFHEQLSLVERDRAAAFFADMENGAPVLICSEIGSEGRNFQFAHHMVLFDLPLNPDLLEQRIGRLDRIGQNQTIQIHIPYMENTAQEILFHWYHQSLNAFEQTCPAGHAIFAQVQELLKAQILCPPGLSNGTKTGPHDSLQELLSQSQTLHHQLELALHEGRDKILEYNSCRQPEADRLKSLAEQIDDKSTLKDYMIDLFDALGIEHSEHSEKSYIIAPGDHMLNQFPGLPDEGMTITYDRKTALVNEDIQFFTWDHPMVSSAMEMIHSSEMGNTAITTLESTGLSVRLKPGTLLIECLFVIETSAHETLQANRYLPPSTIRIVVDELLREYSDSIPHQLLDTSPNETINAQTAEQIIKVKQAEIQLMISHAEKRCEEQAPYILQAARKLSQDTLDKEIDRLQMLAQLNPNIRTEEISFLNQQRHSLEVIFSCVKPRLDALRVIVVI